MKKPTLCCCFTWILFIELNFTVVFLLISKTLDNLFASRVGGWGILRNGGGGGDPSNGGRIILKWGWMPLYRLCFNSTKRIYCYIHVLISYRMPHQLLCRLPKCVVINFFSYYKPRVPFLSYLCNSVVIVRNELFNAFSMLMFWQFSLIDVNGFTNLSFHYSFNFYLEVLVELLVWFIFSFSVLVKSISIFIKSSFFFIFGSTLSFDGEQLTSIVDTTELVVKILSIFTEISDNHNKLSLYYGFCVFWLEIFWVRK